MKKIGKITINHEKVIKNDELINLKGGEYETGCCQCWRDKNIIVGSTPSTCNDDCYNAFATFGEWIC